MNTAQGQRMIAVFPRAAVVDQDERIGRCVFAELKLRSLIFDIERVRSVCVRNDVPEGNAIVVGASLNGKMTTEVSGLEKVERNSVVKIANGIRLTGGDSISFIPLRRWSGRNNPYVGT